MTPIQKLLLPLLVFICCCACTPCLYIPSGINIPLMSKKDELKINATYGSDGYGLQSSYAYDSCHVVVVNSACSYPGFAGDMLNIKVETGIGRFKKRKNGIFDVIGGVGYGLGRGMGSLHGPLISDQNYRTINGQFVNLFVQADCGWIYKDFEWGLGLRVNALGTFGTFECEQWEGGFYGGGGPLHMFNDYKTNIDQVTCLIEPGFMMASGRKHFKLTWAVGCSLVAGPDTGLPPISLYQPLYITMGLRADLLTKK